MRKFFKDARLHAKALLYSLSPSSTDRYNILVIFDPKTNIQASCAIKQSANKEFNLWFLNSACSAFVYIRNALENRKSQEEDVQKCSRLNIESLFSHTAMIQRDWFIKILLNLPALRNCHVNENYFSTRLWIAEQSTWNCFSYRWFFSKFRWKKN